MDIYDWFLVLGPGLFLSPSNLAVNSPISKIHKLVENTLVKVLDMSKGGVQSGKILENSYWLLDFPSLGFSMASSLAVNFSNRRVQTSK